MIDNDTDIISNLIQKSKNMTWTTTHSKAIGPTLHGKLVLYNKVLEITVTMH